MPKIEYIPRSFRASTLRLIEIANGIIEEYAAQGYDLTLRQLYYQMVSRAIIPNNDREYKNLGSIINDARLAGLIDWNRIVDRTRNLRGLAHWDDPADVIDAARASFRLDRWVGQDYRLECWVEKDALIGVIERVCNTLDIPYFACRGYTSQSEMWGAARRLQTIYSGGQVPVILYLGDHDPSGIDMTRDVLERLEMFMGGCKVERLALNWNQIEQYNPPPNPAKFTDSRANAYVEEYGAESWELDALEPSVISDLIRSAANRYIDQDLWKQTAQSEAAGKSLLKKAVERWDDIAAQLDSEAA
jgi:hypothetical protein